MTDEERLSLPQVPVADILQLSGVTEALERIQTTLAWVRPEPMLLALSVFIGSTFGAMQRVQSRKDLMDDWHERFQVFLATAIREAIEFNQTHTDQEVAELATLLDDTHDPKATKH